MSPQPSRRATLVTLAALLAFAAPVRAAGDPERGARVARLCMACHSFEPGRHMTGPSLGGVWGRKAGAAEGFARYSEALQRSGLVWDEQHLDAWLKDPAALVPGNEMSFSGIDDARTRANLLAYLEAAPSWNKACCAWESSGSRAMATLYQARASASWCKAAQAASASIRIWVGLGFSPS